MWARETLIDQSVPVRRQKGQCLWRGKHCYSTELL